MFRQVSTWMGLAVVLAMVIPGEVLAIDWNSRNGSVNHQYLDKQDIVAEAFSKPALPQVYQTFVNSVLHSTPQGTMQDGTQLPAAPPYGGSLKNSDKQGLQSILQSVPLAFASGNVSGSLSPNATNLNYQSDRLVGRFSLGLGYYNQGPGAAGAMGQGGLAGMLGGNVALGGLTVVNDLRKDVVVNAVWLEPNTGILIKLSGGYLWGRQDFTFPTGPATVDLGQYSGLISGSWIASDDTRDPCSCLHSIGVSFWGARVEQTSLLDPLYFMKQTESYYMVYRDNRRLSEGRLFGLAADTQVAMLPNVVAKGAIGFEQVEFPFADGTRERDGSLYSDLLVYWEPIRSITLGAGWKNGVTEDRYTLSAESGHWKVNAWYSMGDRGLVNDRGVSLTYSLLTSGSAKPVSLAMRMRPTRRGDNGVLLGEAFQRPTQLPSVFLAKVDPSDVDLVLRIGKSGLPKNDPDRTAAVNVDGELRITVGSGAALDIQEVRRNDEPFAYAGIVGIAGSQVTIASKKLTTPGTYVISVKDGAMKLYGIAITVE